MPYKNISVICAGAFVPLDSFEAEVGGNCDMRPCPRPIGVTSCGLFCPLKDTQLQIIISSPRSVSPSTSGLKGQTSLYKQGGKGGEGQGDTQWG